MTASEECARGNMTVDFVLKLARQSEKIEDVLLCMTLVCVSRK